MDFVHEEPGLQEFDKNLLEVISAVDAPTVNSIVR